jgi:multidrug resistance efflux pump
MNTDRNEPTAQDEPSQHGPESPTGANPQNSTGTSSGSSKAITSIVVIVITLAACAACAFYYAKFVAPYESTDNAFIEGYVIPMASQVPGRVAELLVKDNQAVKAGRCDPEN